MSGRHRQRGVALLLALVAAVLVDTGLLLLAGALRLRQEEERRDTRELRLLALADAALARTLAGLDLDPGCAGLAEEPFGEGWIAAEVAPGPGSLRTVHARSRWGSGGLAVEAQVEMTRAGPVVLRWRRLPPEP